MTMRKMLMIVEVKFVKDHVLRLRFEDGVEHLADFGPYFRDLATAGERRYSGPVRFKKIPDRWFARIAMGRCRVGVQRGTA